MQYSIKLTGDGKEIFFGAADDDKGIIKSVEIYLDTIDDAVRSKSDAMLSRIKIVGKIQENTSQRLIDVFNWSLEMSSEKIYKKLEIGIYNSEKILRQYIFPEMFVVDYKEVYTADGHDKDEKPYFELYLTQKENNLKAIDTF